jgi:hypothetical protein
MDDEVKSDEGAEVVSIRTGRPEERTYEKTLLSNGRRYNPGRCEHKGPFVVDPKLASVECQDCGALLNPIYVLEQMARHETYWNMRQKELSQYLSEINKEIQDRERTKCTHCGNMTAIRFKKEMPRTWFPTAY